MGKGRVKKTQKEGGGNWEMGMQKFRKMRQSTIQHMRLEVKNEDLVEKVGGY